jgi:tetratricopeptide (TPR) repeat protein
VATLTERYKSFVLSEAGFELRALGRLAEAAESMQAGLDTDIAQEDWSNAVSVAGNLSELYVTMGDLTQSLEFAQQSVDLADKSDDAFQRMIARTTLADVLHQADRAGEAQTLFGEAEAMQKEGQPEHHLLYSLRGFQYCDLLLSQGKFRDVQKRAGQTIEIGRRRHWLLDIGLDHISLGRAHLAEAQEERGDDFSKAAEHLNKAVDGLREAGQQDYIARGLLARAALYRVTDDFPRARHDLDQAMAIAERGGMGLHRADAHLEFARLYLAMGEEAEAREHLATARESIKRMGYHRRDDEVAELEGRLGAG